VTAPEDAVAFRAAYERFPAAVKGAFLLRGADGLPHQVRIAAARAVEVAGGDREPIAIEPTILEIAPTMDTFVPFEVSTLDLLAGWYRLECEVVVDGIAGVVHAGAPFSMPWPRGQVRRGTVSIGAKAGEVSLLVLECTGDRIAIAYEAAAAPEVRLRVDGRPHTVVEVAFDAQAGGGRIVAYPVLRDDARLEIDLKGHGSVEVALP
jgi:hypothetical protein